MNHLLVAAVAAVLTFLLTENSFEPHDQFSNSHYEVIFDDREGANSSAVVFFCAFVSLR